MYKEYNAAYVELSNIKSGSQLEMDSLNRRLGSTNAALLDGQRPDQR